MRLVAGLACRESGLLPGHHQVAEDRAVLEQRVVLGHDPHDAALHRLRLLADQHVPGVGRVEAGQDPEQARLADPRRPEQADHLARSRVRAGGCP